MNSDNITEIGIDELGRLFIKPETKQFSYIWRSATEVHWDNNGFLYSPKPREWTYFMWYKQILFAIKDEYGCSLLITSNTKWFSVPEDLKQEILSLNKP